MLAKDSSWGEEKVPGVFSARRPFKDRYGVWRNETSFSLSDLKVLLTVACDAKKWIADHVLKR